MGRVERAAEQPEPDWPNGRSRHGRAVYGAGARPPVQVFTTLSGRTAARGGRTAAEGRTVADVTVISRNRTGIRHVLPPAMSDSIGLYLNEIGKVPLLTAEEEKELSRVIEAGREAERRLDAGEKGRGAAQGRGRRGARQGPVHPGQPPPGRQHRPPLPPARRHGPPRPDPGGQPRPRARRRQVRLAQGLQVLHLRHLLDPPGHRPGPRPEGQPRPPPGRPLGQPARRAAPGVRRRRRARRRERPAAPAHHPGLARPHRRRRRRHRRWSTSSPTDVPRPEDGRAWPGRRRAARRAARHARHPGPLRRRAPLRPARRRAQELPGGRRGARRHRRGRPPAGQAGRRRPAATTPPGSWPPEVPPARRQRAARPPHPTAPTPAVTQPCPPGVLPARRLRVTTWRGSAPAVRTGSRDRAARNRVALAARTGHAGAMARPWTPSSWRDFPAAQQPDWPDEAALERALKQIATLPAARLRRRGPQPAPPPSARSPPATPSSSRPATAPSASTTFSAVSIREKLQVILQMAVVLTYSIGRAGGEGRPHRRPVRQAPLVGHRDRSATSSCPAFRGHIVNDIAPTAAARAPDPERLVQAYHQSASTLNLLRAFTKGGFADLSRVHAWNQEFVATQPRGRALRGARRRDRAGPALHAGLRHRHSRAARQLHEVDFYTSHEALHPRLRGGAHPPGLPHRRLVRLLGPHALDRRAHPPARRRPRRVPARRRQPDRLQARPDADADEVLELCEALNPDRVPGRLTLITRMGADHVEDARCRPLLRAVRDAGHPVRVGLRPDARQHLHLGGRPQDPPLRGHPGRDRRLLPGPPGRGHLAGRRPRRADRRRRHRVPRRRRGRRSTSDLDDRYETMCDPRLNGRQSLDLAFRVAELIHA